MFVFVVLFLCGCAGGPGRHSQKQLTVITTFQPLYSLAHLVAEGSKGIQVVNPPRPHEGPHDFVPEHPAFIRRLSEADAIVTLRQLKLADNFDRLYPLARRTNIRIVEIDLSKTWSDSAPRMPLIANPNDYLEPMRIELSVTFDTANPHTWLSFQHAIHMARRLAEDFSALDPANAATYERNATALTNRLRSEQKIWTSRFAQVETPEVVAITEGFPYLTWGVGVDVLGYALNDRSPKEVLEMMREFDCKVILAEEDPGDELRSIVEMAGGNIVVLDTMEHGRPDSAGGLDPEAYFEIMNANLEALLVALK